VKGNLEVNLRIILDLTLDFVRIGIGFRKLRTVLWSWISAAALNEDVQITLMIDCSGLF